MYCTSCGKKLSDNAKFCTFCGKACAKRTSENYFVDSSEQDDIPADEDLIQEDAPESQEDPISDEDSARYPSGKQTKHNKKKAALYSVLAILLVIVVVAAVLVFRWYNSAEKRILRALDAEDYNSAIVIVEEDASVSESKRLAEQLKTRLSNIKSGFKDGSLEYASAKAELDTIGRLNVDGISAELSSVQNYIEQLNGSRTNFAAAESFYSTGDYAEAIANYRLVIEDDSSYPAAVEKLADAIDKYREEILEKAQDYADAELYTDAIALLNEALETIPNDMQLTERGRIYEKDNTQKQKDDALETAAEYADSGDYLRAFKSLANSVKSQASDAELVSAYNRYRDQYVSLVIKDADQKADEKNFDEALSLLKAALKELPGNEALTEKVNEVEAKAPVSVASLSAINSNHWETWNAGSAVDPFGNDYSSTRNYIVFRHLDTATHYHYAEYRLYGKFSTLTGAVSPQEDNRQDGYSYLQVYADDDIVYTSPSITRKTDAFPFTVDISGADYIKVYLTTHNGGSIILSDVLLWP